MSPHFLTQLRAQGAEVQERWRTLLHVEPVSGPLANPAALQYLIPEAWQQVLQRLEKKSRRRTPISLLSARAELPACDCGHNPYRAFFAAAEQAISEAGVLIQAEQSAETRSATDLAELIYAIRTLARIDIDTFCSACIHVGVADRCRFPVVRKSA